MKALGIVAEYNPFHNGHKYHLNRSLELTSADILICVMSGNFVQRGEPAIINKWKRAEFAIQNGVNLVIELPTLYATQNAGIFSKGAIEILERLDCEYISFGVEEFDSNKIVQIKDFLIENEELVENEIKTLVKSGLAYPKARENVIVNHLGKDYANIIDKPNNILAIEYLKNIKKSKPIYVNRYKVEHNGDYNLEFASGSYIRNLILNKDNNYLNFIPYDLKIDNPISKELLFNEIISLSLNQSEDYLNSIFGAEEGLGSIIKNRFRYWNNYSNVCNDLKSKRYTETRINRVLLNMILGIKKSDINNSLPYARVLAFDSIGQKYIKNLKNKNVDIPIITNINKEITSDIKESIMFDIKASDLYNKLSGNNLYENSDFVVMPSRF